MSPSDLASWFIGLVGFSYPEWESTLYTSAPFRAHRLTHYAAHFKAVEINTTFYGIPTSKAVQDWDQATPAGFRFCLKMPRDITHGPTPPGSLAAPGGPPPGHLLKESTLAMARQFLETLRPLGDKLGSVLLQFPPKFTADHASELASFLDQLGSAVPLAIELRHDSWWTPETTQLLKDRAVCWAATDESPQAAAEAAPNKTTSSGRAPRSIIPTSTFLYVRWLGKHDQFKDRSHERFDPTARLQWWLQRLSDLLSQNPQVRTIFGFFDNDFSGHSPTTARRFTVMIGTSPQRHDVADQPILFGG